MVDNHSWETIGRPSHQDTQEKYHMNELFFSYFYFSISSYIITQEFEIKNYIPQPRSDDDIARNPTYVQI